MFKGEDYDPITQLKSNKTHLNHQVQDYKARSMQRNSIENS